MYIYTDYPPVNQHRCGKPNCLYNNYNHNIPIIIVRTWIV